MGVENKSLTTNIDPLRFDEDFPLSEIDPSLLEKYHPEPVKEEIIELFSIVHSRLGLRGWVSLRYAKLDSAHAALQELSNAFRNSFAVRHRAGVFPVTNEDGTEEVILLFAEERHIARLLKLHETSTQN